MSILLIHGDCIEEMKKLESNSIDLICTDLPYGTTKCKWDVIIPFDNIKHLEDIDPKVKECVKFVPVKTIDEALAVNLT